MPLIWPRDDHWPIHIMSLFVVSVNVQNFAPGKEGGPSEAVNRTQCVVAILECGNFAKKSFSVQVHFLFLLSICTYVRLVLRVMTVYKLLIAMHCQKLIFFNCFKLYKVFFLHWIFSPNVKLTYLHLSSWNIVWSDK